MVKPDYLSFSDAVTFLGCTREVLRALIISKKIQVFVAASGWKMLWLEPRTGKSARGSKVNESSTKPISISSIDVVDVDDNGRHAVQIEYEDGTVVRRRLVIKAGYYRLHPGQASAVAAAKKGTVSGVYAIDKADDEGFFRMVRYNRKSEELRVYRRPVQLSALWLSAQELESLKRENLPPSELKRRQAVSDASANRHAVLRAEVLGAAFAVLARWPQRASSKGGVVEATRVAKLIEEKADQFWPQTGKARLELATIEDHLRTELRKVEPEPK